MYSLYVFKLVVMVMDILQDALLTLTAKNLTKSYRDYLQNTPHMVLRNPSLYIVMERLTCLNNSRSVPLGTLTQHVVGSGFEPWPPRAHCTYFFPPPSSLPSYLGRKFFNSFPTTPVKVLGLNISHNTHPAEHKRQKRCTRTMTARCTDYTANLKSYRR